MDGSNEIRGLSLTNGGQYIVVCHNSDVGCNAYNASELHDNNLWRSPPEAVLHGNDPVAMFPGENVGEIYTRSALIMSSQYHMALGQYALNSRVTVDDIIIRSSHYTASESYRRIFHTGFLVILHTIL